MAAKHLGGNLLRRGGQRRGSDRGSRSSWRVGGVGGGIGVGERQPAGALYAHMAVEGAGDGCRGSRCCHGGDGLLLLMLLGSLQGGKGDKEEGTERARNHACHSMAPSIDG